MKALQSFCSSVLLTTSIMVTGCSPSSETSAVQEAWDSLNAPEVFGVKTLRIDQLSQPSFLRGKLISRPWTDSYWPLSKIGVADRWLNVEATEPFQFTAEVEGPDDPRDPEAARADWQRYRSEVKVDISAALADAKSWSEKDWNEAVYISPAEKYDIAVGDEGFGLTSQELVAFSENRKHYRSINWRWMGHCHGWAAASYLYETPKHGVLMTNESTGKEALFTPGDVRALLTKGASDNPIRGRQQFMGSRCDTPNAKIVRDDAGRIIDASLGTFDFTSRRFKESKSVRVLRTNWHGSHVNSQRQIRILVQFGAEMTEGPVYILEGDSDGWLGQGREVEERILGVKLYSTRLAANGQILKDQLIGSKNAEEVGRFIADNGSFLRRDGTFVSDPEKVKAQWDVILADLPESERDPSAYLQLKYHKACRDLNPGSFHIVLARYLSEGATTAVGLKPQSFVLDITFDAEVWNQAVYRFESKVGEPTPLRTYDQDGNVVAEDPLIEWRSPGTVALVDVYTLVSYAVENGPRAVYAPTDDALHQVVYRYTLELDDNGFVIGGEWHKGVSVSAWEQVVVRSGSALLTALGRNAQASNSPDFIWSYEEGSEIGETRGSVVRAAFLKKLHGCSVDANAAVEQAQLGQLAVPYVRCQY